jgi:hypothetical protein
LPVHLHCEQAVNQAVGFFIRPRFLPDGTADLTGPWVGGGSNTDIEFEGGLKPGELPLLPWARELCDAGELQAGLGYLRRAVARGYAVAPTLAGSRQFDPLRSDPAFEALLVEAEAGRRRALGAFREAGGTRLLGV